METESCLFCLLSYTVFCCRWSDLTLGSRSFQTLNLWLILTHWTHHLGIYQSISQSINQSIYIVQRHNVSNASTSLSFYVMFLCSMVGWLEGCPARLPAPIVPNVFTFEGFNQTWNNYSKKCPKWKKWGCTCCSEMYDVDLLNVCSDFFIHGCVMFVFSF